ncbi:MAG: prepilin peptidase [Deltaproteobacteria bacterium]|nr:prepilin peptidase [Deltaproteobacteria bacterium]
MNMLQLLPISTTLAIALIATYTDLKKGTISNYLTLSAAIFGVVFSLSIDGIGGAAASLSWALAGALVPAILFKFNAMGGGDVKLFFAMGALLKNSSIIEIEMTAFIIGAIYGIALFIANGVLLKKIRAVAAVHKPFVKNRVEFIENDKTEIKFAPSILGAVVIVQTLNLFNQGIF